MEDSSQSKPLPNLVPAKFNFSALPVDLRRHIIAQLDIADLQTLRTFGRNTKQLADERVDQVKGAYWRRIQQSNVGNTLQAASKYFTQASEMWSGLKSLDLSGQNLGDFHFEALSKCKWPLLESLNLNRNHCSAQSAACFAENGSVSWPRLQKLYFNRNDLGDGVATIFHANWSLVELDLSSNGVTAAGLESLPEAPHHWHQLRSLSLASNPKIGDNGVRKLAEAAHKFSRLEILNLKGVRMGDNGLEAVAYALRHWAHLATLELGSVGKKEVDYIFGDNWDHVASICRNSYTEVGIALLANAIMQHSLNLRKLGLYSTAIGDHGARELAKCERGFSELDLGDCGIGRHGALFLMEGRERWSTGLRKLDLRGNDLTDIGLLRLSLGHCFGPLLKELNLRCNGLGPSSASALAEIGDALPSLRVLNLSGNNQITDDGIFNLLRHSWVNLTEIDLSGTGITYIGVGRFARKTVGWTQLRKLNLAGNLLGSQGLYAFFIDEREWPSLQHLDLSDNLLGSSQGLFGALIDPRREFRPFEKALHLLGNRTHSLESLILDNNALRTISPLVSSSNWRYLENLSLRGNPLGQNGAQELAEAALNGNFPRLSQLRLERCNLADIGLENLLEASFPALTLLDLECNGLTSAGAGKLCRASGNFPKLKVLLLGRNNLRNCSAMNLTQYLCSGFIPGYRNGYIGRVMLPATSFFNVLTVATWSLSLPCVASAMAGFSLSFACFYRREDLFGKEVVGGWPRLECISLEENQVSLAMRVKIVKNLQRPGVKYIW